VTSLAYACPGCGGAVEGVWTAGLGAIACPACGHELVLLAASAPETGAVPRPCPVCGSDEHYAQRDFNRKLGLAIAAVGLLLGPFTAWISTVVAIALDALLYLLVPLVAVCYACNAQTRGFEKRLAPPAFEIAIHDAYKFGKRFPPRREAAVAGPHATRLAYEGKPPSPPPLPRLRG
jgi:hypothetical protein